jgi:hypothetical protein
MAQEALAQSSLPEDSVSATIPQQVFFLCRKGILEGCRAQVRTLFVAAQILTKVSCITSSAACGLLAATVKEAVSSIEALRHDTATLHQEIKNRLAKLPNEIAEGVNPTSIATILAESLRQQFMQSGLPETSKALALIAQQSRQAATEFGYSSRQIV